MLKEIWKCINTPSVILCALLGGLTLAILFTFRQYGTTFDERDMIALGNRTLTFYTSFGKDTSFLSLSKQPEFFLTHGSFIEVLRSAIVSLLPLHTLDMYHLILALFAVSGFFFIFRITYMLTKNVWIAVSSFLLLVCMPRFYGDIFTNSKDIAPTCILLGIIYFALLYFQGNRRLWQQVVLGIFFAIGISLRPILLVAYTLFIVISFIQTFLEKQSFQSLIKKQAIIFVITSISFFLISPYLLLHPTEIIHLISASEKYPWTGAILFARLMYNPNAIPWYYLPEWITITTPIITLIFFAIGNSVIIMKMFKQKFSSRYAYSFILFLFWVPLLIVFYQHPIIYDAWRQFLFLSGPLILLTSIGLWALVQSKRKVIAYGASLFFVINIFLTTQQMIQLHPYEYIYFNSFIGGLPGAYGKYETDYWGASFKEATEWVDTHRKSFAATDGITYISPCLPFLVVPYISQGVVIKDGKAHLVYCYTRWDEDKNLPGKIVHVVQREGVPLNVIHSLYE